MGAFMSAALWCQLPDRFLKISFKRFAQLDYDVRLLIIDLARNQKFKCALCDDDRALEIEHDHDPAYGTGKKPTIYNIRGLTCRACNFHLGLYERDKNGEAWEFGDITCRISDRKWEDYNYAYDCRFIGLYEDKRKEQMGIKYWPRKVFLDKFDDWREF
jgi:hypothetical protein